MTRRLAPRSIACLALALLPCAAHAADAGPLYVYTLRAGSPAATYDEAVAASTIQGVVNRSRPQVYLESDSDPRAAYWLRLFSDKSGWLANRKIVPVSGLEALVRLAAPELQGAVIWDPAVPASLDVATTAAGVEDAVVLSPELARRLLPATGLRVVLDLRDRFTGSETGSRKNDAYRWAVRTYLDTGRCSAHRLCLYEDAFTARGRGSLAYAVTRDWAVYNRAFVFDLSPWGDEAPEDDPHQRIGLDKESYQQILAATLRRTAGHQTTELTGFFVFDKYANVAPHRSRHEPVPTEWESVWLMTPYNCYQNTVSSDCYNESLHSQAPRMPLAQTARRTHPELRPRAYVAILMADYDSSTPLYQTMPDNWDDPGRGKMPFAWGINPSLLETYPDIIAHLYATATPMDTFTSDASAAGYTNPDRVRPEYLPLFVAHNKRFFNEAAMDMAPMVLDFDQPSDPVKDAFLEFAPSGIGTIIYDFHNAGGHAPVQHVWKGMPVVELINDAGEPADAQKTAERMVSAIQARGVRQPGFYFFRIVWSKPSTVIRAVEILRRRLAGTDIEVVDPHAFMELFALNQKSAGK